MRRIRNIVLSFFAVSLAITAMAEKATIRITMPDNKVTTRTVDMKKLDGQEVYRVQIPVREIPREALYLDVVADSAKAKKGDPGWCFVGDGSYMEFTCDNGKYSCIRRISLMGYKTPSGCAAIIVKGLEFEYHHLVVAKDGNYDASTYPSVVSGGSLEDLESANSELKALESEKAQVEEDLSEQQDSYNQTTSEKDAALSDIDSVISTGE